MDETTRRPRPPILVDCPRCGDPIELGDTWPQVRCATCRIVVEVAADGRAPKRRLATAA